MFSPRALLSGLIDYAGLYPPASLPLPEAVANYQRYFHSPESWMLNRLVLPASLLSEFGRPPEAWQITLIADEEPFELPPFVASVETRDLRGFTRPVYRELPLADIEDGFAKIRTAAISTEDLAEFLLSAAARRLPFKATAGLHHPIRSPETGRHGFVNVFLAAALAWHGAESGIIHATLDETDPAVLANAPLTTTQVETARRDFAHSFGSCSFDEPVEDLKRLGWL